MTDKHAAQVELGNRACSGLALAAFFDQMAERLRLDADDMRTSPGRRYYYNEIADDYAGRALILRRTQSARSFGEQFKQITGGHE
jgi:hypothetical protein